jgi:hypothetical protein
MPTSHRDSSAFDSRNRFRGLRSPRWTLLVTAVVATGLAFGAASSVGSQDKPDEAELKQKVAELVKGLDASKATERQAAQAELVKLGPATLPLLPKPDADDLSAEQKRRLGEVRAALGQASGKATLTASKITLTAKAVTLSDAIAAIQRQSGNEIVDMREEFGQPVTNPEFATDWKDKGFWEVLNELASKTGIGYYLHTDARQIGLVMEPQRNKPTAYAGPLRIQLNQVVRQINFDDGRKECVLDFEFAWEPRVRPILFELKPQNLEVVDDQDRKIAVEENPNPQQAEGEGMSLKASVSSSEIVTQFIVRLSQPNKGAEKIKSLAGKLDVLVPANIQTFEFDALAKAKDVRKQSGNVTVVLEKFKELDTGLWAAEVMLQFDSKSEAFESYETWFYDNEAFLQRADGTRFPNNAGQTLTESDDGRVGIQYRFVDAPGKMADYKFVYKTPATIVRESVPFELKDIELP